MIELMLIGGILVMGALFLAVLGAILFVVKMLFWVVLLPFRLALHLVLLPIKLAVVALAGVVVLPVLALGLGAVFVVALAGVFLAVLLPLAPFLFVATIVWLLVRRRTRPLPAVR